jgi:hypothetical protein
MFAPKRASRRLEVHSAFEIFDQDGNGRISFKELQAVLQGIDHESWSDRNVELLLASMDQDGDGKVQMAEFLAWVFSKKKNSDTLETCRAIITKKGEWRPYLRRVWYGTQRDVANPPVSLDDPALVEYLLREELHAALEKDEEEKNRGDGGDEDDGSQSSVKGRPWRIEVESISSHRAVLSSGFSIEVLPDMSKHVTDLLSTVPDRMILVGELGRCEAPVLNGVVALDFSREDPEYADAPPSSVDDPELEKYRNDDDGDGWFVKIERFNVFAKLAVLSNGLVVAVRAQDAHLLQRCLLDIPASKICCGMLLCV